MARGIRNTNVIALCQVAVYGFLTEDEPNDEMPTNITADRMGCPR